MTEPLFAFQTGHDALRFETDRLILRPLELTDAPNMQRLAAHSDVAATNLNMPHPYPEGAAEAFIEAQADIAPNITLGMVRKSDLQWMGVIHLDVNLRHQRADFGYWIGVPYWNQGYTSEAARRLVNYCFADLGLNRVCAGYFTHNPASRRVMEKAGLTYEGTLRQHYERFGAFHDVGYCGILRSEWLARQPSP
jgi:RimJ/RimL family protein N-acetyltransferase